MPANGPIDTLIKRISALPGLGPRSARRIVYTLLTRRRDLLEGLIAALQDAAQNVGTCGTCGNLDTHNPCRLCSDTTREDDTLCIVATLSDLAAIERARIFKGRYIVLGGTLSALDGIGPDKLNIGLLESRLHNDPPQEIVLALNATVEGQATAHYILDLLQSHQGIKISRLGQGVPFGSELDYLDEGTIAAALSSRAMY